MNTDYQPDYEALDEMFAPIEHQRARQSEHSRVFRQAPDKLFGKVIFMFLVGVACALAFVMTTSSAKGEEKAMVVPDVEHFSKVSPPVHEVFASGFEPGEAILEQDDKLDFPTRSHTRGALVGEMTLR